MQNAARAKRVARRRERRQLPPFEDVNDRSGIQSARATQKNGALQQAHIHFAVEAVTALRVRCGQKGQALPIARKAEEEMASLRATSEMRRSGWRPGDFDEGEKFFLLDTGPGFL